MSINERIRKVRKRLDLTQAEFGKRIRLKGNSVALIEGGRKTSEQTIFSICKTFNVSEEWLRTGEGEMFETRSREDELAAAVERLMTGEREEFKRRFVVLLSMLDENQWETLYQYAWKLVDGLPTPGLTVPSVEETPEERYERHKREARAEAEEYYQEVLAEKTAEENAQVSEGQGAETA